MLDPTDYDDVIVTVAHPHGDVDAPLALWLERGPGPRPYLGLAGARRASTGEPIPLSEIPTQFHNPPD